MILEDKSTKVKYDLQVDYSSLRSSLVDIIQEVISNSYDLEKVNKLTDSKIEAYVINILSLNKKSGDYQMRKNLINEIRRILTRHKLTGVHLKVIYYNTLLKDFNDKYANDLFVKMQSRQLSILFKKIIKQHPDISSYQLSILLADSLTADLIESVNNLLKDDKSINLVNVNMYESTQDDIADFLKLPKSDEKFVYRVSINDILQTYKDFDIEYLAKQTNQLILEHLQITKQITKQTN